MSTAARLAGLLLYASVPAAALADSCVWYADDDSIRQVQSGTNLVAAVVPLKHPNRLLMNAEDCGVWALNKEDRRLLRYAADGSLEREINVRSLDPRLDEIELAQIDPYDGSLWVGDERRVYHISSAGQLLGSFAVPAEVRRLRVALDQSLWLLGRRDLWHFDNQGVLLAGYALARHLADDARHFEVDSVGGLIWLADEDELARLKLSSPTDPPVRMRLASPIRGFALDPLSGNVWVGQASSLVAFDREGLLAHTTNLDGLGIRKPEKLAFDPVSRSLWLGAERSVARFTDAGEFVIRFAARDGDEALGVPALRVLPSLVLVRPPQDALTNNPQPQFTLAYGVQCNGLVCGFGNGYLARYSLSAVLNDQPVGQLFAFDLNSGQSIFTPASRLPEGANTFSAQVRDPFGHDSNRITNNFTVDTIPPRFLTVTPPDGSSVSTPNVVIQGSVDDPGATIVLAGLGLTQTGATFSFPVLLAPGVNTFVLTATDKAGNVATTALHLILATVSISVTSPVAGATINADNVTVSGTLQGPSNTGVTVNGIPAVVNGNTFIAAAVPLATGTNALTVVATTPDRQTATQTLSVNSTGPAPIRVSASVYQGLAPLDVAFTVTSTTTKGLLVIQADFTGSGSFNFFSPGTPISNRYATPGTYQAVFNVVDSTGTAFRQTITIVVQDPAQVDQMLREAWTGFTGALVSRNAAQALQYFNSQGQQKYGPVLETLAPTLPQIAGSFSPLQSSSIGDSVAEYAVNRMIDGTNRVFLIYFLLDVDGVWRLDSM
jgi:glucodextranase-like protein